MAMVLREGRGTTMIGLALGMAVATLVMRATADLRFGVAALDAIAFSVAAILLLVVALAACLLPAWRAGAVDPVAALSAH